MTIAEAIRKMNKPTDKVLICTVTATDTQARTCTVEPVGGQAGMSARIQAKIGTSGGFAIFPKIGSDVVVTLINDTTGFISVCSEISHISLSNDVADLSEQLGAVLDTIDAAFDTILQIKVITPAGPSTGLLPDNIAAIAQQRAAIAQTKTKLQNLIR